MHNLWETILSESKLMRNISRHLPNHQKNRTAFYMAPGVSLERCSADGYIIEALQSVQRMICKRAMSSLIQGGL